MGTAKHKLNAAHFQGVLIVAGLLGLATGSSSVFVFALIGLLIASVMSGDIRR